MTTDSPQSALILTEAEWADLAEVCKHFLGQFPTPSSLGLPNSPGGAERWEVTDRRRAIASRIVEATSWHQHTDDACCMEHDHHVAPHRRCILR